MISLQQYHHYLHKNWHNEAEHSQFSYVILALTMQFFSSERLPVLRVSLIIAGFTLPLQADYYDRKYVTFGVNSN